MYQYQLLLLLTWYEIVATLKISTFVPTNTAGKCPEASSETSGFAAKNTAGKRPHVSLKMSHFVDNYKAVERPCVSLQIFLYVAINTAGKCFDVLFKILVSGDINSA